MIVRSKAPLRLGLAGGGSDVSPYSDLYGGVILNATIDLYAYCTIEEINYQYIEIESTDLHKKFSSISLSELPIDGNLDLHKGVYNHIIKKFHLSPLSFKLTTYSDAPAGSGLGSSSTMVIAIIKVFVEWLNLPMGDYEIAHMAYEIERKELALTGGKQDQYAAAFGGFNFMEFLKNDHVIVNPLRINNKIIEELEASIVLYYTGASRSSAKIIDEQIRNTSSGNLPAIEAMHKIKQAAYDMKTAILMGDIKTFAKILGSSWENKKKMAKAINNSLIQDVFDIALAAGALAGKVSGAGGGGFIIFIVEPTRKYTVTEKLNELEGKVVNFHFSTRGTYAWKIY